MANFFRYVISNPTDINANPINHPALIYVQFGITEENENKCRNKIYNFIQTNIAAFGQIGVNFLEDIILKIGENEITGTHNYYDLH